MLDSPLLPGQKHRRGRCRLRIGNIERDGCWRTLLAAGLVLVGGLATLAVRAWAWSRPGRDTDLHTDLKLVDFEYAKRLAAEAPRQVAARCSWVVDQILQHNAWKPREVLVEQFLMQASDSNLYYRGVAYMFWLDFVQGGWGAFNLSQVIGEQVLIDGSPLERTATWTWITGDQHLSNFGAWKNRHGEIVYGVNDFDEAAVFDFHIDVWRLAVSIYDHAMSNSYGPKASAEAVTLFAHRYVEAVIGYVANDDATLFELTPRAARGALQSFLKKVEVDNSEQLQLHQFTTVDSNGQRRFLCNSNTKLVPAEPDVARSLRASWNAWGYGATLQKIGWHAKEWSDAYFRINDIAKRLGSGDGSYGTTRYYVLIAGTDSLLDEARGMHDAVILDIKYAAAPAVRDALPNIDRPWFESAFMNDARRAIKAQRQLTSYTDPFTGWVEINGDIHSVRQRSPWKAALDLGTLSQDDFYEYITQVAVVTATSHCRSTFESAPPTRFKDVIATALAHPTAREKWARSIASTASVYREQVLLDFGCFSRWVKANISTFELAELKDRHERIKATSQVGGTSI